MKRMVVLILPVFFFIVMGRACLAQPETRIVTNLSPRRTSLPPSPVKIPFRTHGFFSAMEVMINNQGPFLFELDTGCGSTMISKEVVKRLRLPLCRGSVKSTDAAGRSGEYEVAHFCTLRLGKAEFQEGYAKIADFHVLANESRPVPDGILGFDLFKDVLLTVDFSRRQAILENGRLPPPDYRDILPISCLSGGMPYCTVEIGQRKIDVAIDTGSNGAFLFPESFVKTLSFYPGRRKTDSLNLSGRSSGVTARLAETVRIGRHALSDPLVNWNTGVPGQFLLGMEVLKYFTITFDQRGKVIRFSRSAQDSIRFPRLRSLGMAFHLEKGQLRIAQIMPGTPAEKLDLKPGDQLIAAEGRPAENLDNAAFLALIDRRDVVLLELKRGNKQFKIPVSIDIF